MSQTVNTSFFIFILICAILLSSCGFDPLTGVDSPGGEQIAFVYKKRFSSSVTYVSIIGKDDTLPRKGNVAVFRGLVSLTVEWEGEEAIKLHAPETANLISISKQVNGVGITLMRN